MKPGLEDFVSAQKGNNFSEEKIEKSKPKAKQKVKSKVDKKTSFSKGKVTKHSKPNSRFDKLIKQKLAKPVQKSDPKKTEQKYLNELQASLGIDSTTKDEISEYYKNLALRKKSSKKAKKNKKKVDSTSNDSNNVLSQKTVVKPAPAVDVIVFDDPAKRNFGKKKKIMSASSEDDILEPKGINMGRARAEILQLVITGLDGTKKEDAKRELALKLGAKPPKNEYVNYKDLLVINKEKKIKEEEKREMDRKLGLRVTKAKKKETKKKSKDDIGYLDGQIGRYRSGVQVIDKREIRAMSKGKKQSK
ncbi:unnamed protein product [Owenia fusiformis]|uniref:Uncharacterized protein n=1 Tax=Owenia fusiformis TaxID=6347 RepID=A0A8J1TCH4_OWEFU|nr:unnamed protein product [Owenia fusiformis]